MRSFLPSCCLAFVSICVLGQPKINRLSPVINHPANNVSAPFVSLDGNSLLFVSDNSEGNVLTVYYTTRPDGVNWKEPAELARNINTRQNFLRGFALSADGRQLFITSAKSGGLGGYDIFSSELKGYWQEPMNMGLPVNSPLHEGSPSLTTDGLTMYFMRCGKMNNLLADECKIFVTKRKSTNDRWGQPEELPSLINTGNSQTPRIMGDGETLIFASNKLTPNHGGMDLYLTRWNGVAWAAPQPLDFVNTDKDDQFVSATLLGRYLMKDVAGKQKSELVELLFPPEVKPKAIMKLECKVSGPENLASPYVTVIDKNTQVRISNSRPNTDGTFTLFLKEGGVYSIYIDPEKDPFTFASKEVDLMKGKVPMVEKVSFELKPLAPGMDVPLNNTVFRPYSADLDNALSQTELRKIVRLMNGNPSLNFSIEVTQFNYQEDSTKSNPDLTETKTDTLTVPVAKMVVDSTLLNPDSTFVTKQITTDSIVTKTRFHNDRTAMMAQKLMAYFTSQGIAANRLGVATRRQPATTPERKYLIRIIARQP